MDVNLTLILLLAGLQLTIGFWQWPKIISSIPWRAMAGGVAIAYVFLRLLPALGTSQISFSQEHPRFVEGIYLLSLLGLLLFYSIRCQMRTELLVGAAITTSALSNLLFSYLLTHMARFWDCLLLFTAVGLHFWVNAYGLHARFPRQYQRWGRWILAVSLLAGWGIAHTVMMHTGVSALERSMAIALVRAFLAGNVILGVLTYDLSSTSRQKVLPFTAAALGYAAILLAQPS